MNMHPLQLIHLLETETVIPKGRTMWHGLHSLKPLTGELRAPFYLAYTRDLARAYGSKVIRVRVEPKNPLILRTPEELRDAIQQSGMLKIEGGFHPHETDHFCDWVRAQGYDFVGMPRSAFVGEIGYEWGSGTFGEPQAIALDASIVSLL